MVLFDIPLWEFILAIVMAFIVLVTIKIIEYWK